MDDLIRQNVASDILLGNPILTDAPQSLHFN